MRTSLVAKLLKNLPAMQETLVQFLGWEDPLEKGYGSHSSILGLPWWSDSKESACNPGAWFQSLGCENPLEKDMATHSSILAWRIRMDRGVLRAVVHGVEKSWA